jgi:hypothetical protein
MVNFNSLWKARDLVYCTTWLEGGKEEREGGDGRSVREWWEGMRRGKEEREGGECGKEVMGGRCNKLESKKKKKKQR